MAMNLVVSRKPETILGIVDKFGKLMMECKAPIAELHREVLFLVECGEKDEFDIRLYYIGEHRFLGPLQLP
jgi:hypothetical protein